MTARIINRGRGPEVEGTRVTVYRILDFFREDKIQDSMQCQPGNACHAMRSGQRLGSGAVRRWITPSPTP